MTWGDANAFAEGIRNRESIISGSGSIFDRAKQLSQFDELANKQPKELTMGAVVRSAVGAGLGLGMSRMVGGLFGLSDRTQDKVDNMAMGLAGAYNSGMFKNSFYNEDLDRRNAFRLGFMKAAAANGLMKHSAVLALTPELLVSPFRLAANATSTAGSALGTTLGAADSPDDEDEAVAKLQAERELLRKQLRMAMADRDSRYLKQVLATRK